MTMSELRSTFRRVFEFAGISRSGSINKELNKNASPVNEDTMEKGGGTDSVTASALMVLRHQQQQQQKKKERPSSNFSSQSQPFQATVFIRPTSPVNGALANGHSANGNSSSKFA